MARKRYSDEDVLRLLRDMEMLLADGNDVASACRSVGISDATSELQVALSKRLR